MLWRRLCLARSWSAAGLLTCTMFAAPAMAEPEAPPPSAGVATETVRVLDARQSGDLAVEVRGHGQDRVKITLRNSSAKRLNVVLPPGLVASSATGQGAGGRAGGGGFQSMGLGTPTNRPGSFGQFRASAPDSGFQSVPVAADEAAPNAVTVPAGKTVDLTVPAVCLNFGLPTPTLRDKFELMDVDDYTADVRARKALRTLATLGTSHGVAQATMWRVCNAIPFEMMALQAGKIMNVHEISLAARLVESLDAAGDAELLDAAYLAESRIFVDVDADGPLAADAKRLGEAIDGLHVLGLPVRLVADRQPPAPSAPALYVKVTLTGSDAGETRGRIVINQATRGEGWAAFGKTTFKNNSTAAVIDGPELARTLDHALASAFVTVKVARRAPGSTTLRVENRLPFTLTNVAIRTGNSSGAPTVPFKGVGVGPGRTTLVPIQAASGTIDHIELNGL